MEDIVEDRVEDRNDIAKRVAAEFGILPGVLYEFASGNEDSMRKLAEHIKWEKDKALEDAADSKDQQQKETGDESAAPETRAEREKREIFEKPYFATMEEVGNMSMEQYAKWRDAGGNVRDEESSVKEIVERRESNEAKLQENERLENLSMSQYAKEFNKRE